MALTPSHASSCPCFGEAGEEDSKAQQNFFQEMRGLVPTQSLITCVTLDKSLSCSEPQFFSFGKWRGWLLYLGSNFSFPSSVLLDSKNNSDGILPSSGW